MNINGREIGPGQPPYIIAEISCNHGGKLSRALELIDAAKAIGADAVKFQAYQPETITLNSNRPEFFIQDGPWTGMRLWDLYKTTQTPFGWFPAIKAHAAKVGITWFASVFDNGAVDLMVELDAPAIKIASFEIVDIPLIAYAAATLKPLIISTGMASWAEATAAHWATSRAGGSYIFLRCVSGYPTPAHETGLPSYMFGVEGISDHTTGPEIPIAATALGACIIEKHFRLSWHPDTDDSAFSLDEVDFARMIRQVRNTWAAMQLSNKTSEAASRPLRRSLFAVRDIALGDRFTVDNVRSIRPGHGLSPVEIDKVIGKTAARHIERGEPIAWGMIE